MANKKKLTELVHERVLKRIDTNMVSLVNYLTGLTAQTETELAEVDHMVVKLRKERKCSTSSATTRDSKSHKVSGIGLQSILLGNRSRLVCSRLSHSND